MHFLKYKVLYNILSFFIVCLKFFNLTYNLKLPKKVKRVLKGMKLFPSSKNIVLFIRFYLNYDFIMINND